MNTRKGSHQAKLRAAPRDSALGGLLFGAKAVALAAALITALIATLLATTGCSSDDDGSSGDTEGSSSGSGKFATAAQLCFDTINKHRASIDLPPYSRWTDSESCADDQCMKDSASDTPHGAFNQCGEMAQNECPGWSGPPEAMIEGCLQLMWDEGPGEDFAKHGHYLNMSNTQFKTVACGFFVEPDGQVWSVQNFK